MFGIGAYVKLFTVFFTEFINASSGINHALFTRVKWMTGRTNLYKQILCQYRTGHKRVAAAASYCNLFIYWMNFWFHIAFTLPKMDYLPIEELRIIRFI